MMFPSFDKLIAAEFEQNCQLLAKADFPEVESSIRSLMRLHDASLLHTAAHGASSNPTPPPWFRTLKRILLEAPFPSAVLDAADRFVSSSQSSAAAFALFEETPRSLEVLARLACGSPFLTQVLLSQPEALRELTTERRTAEMKSREEFFAEAQSAILDGPSESERLSLLRKYQRREILRIGMCDAFGLLDLKFVTLQISLLADAMVQTCLNLACTAAGLSEPPLAVIALGKHGGEELNYSSDIDLLLITENDSANTQNIARKLIDGLSIKMVTGFLYRVDMRLRPWGEAGPLVSTPDAYAEYLRSDAQLWEKQALLKARQVAGCASAGQTLLKRLPEMVFTAERDAVLANVRESKGQIEAGLRKRGRLYSEVKLGAGSIRDIEFLVQALQLIHGRNEPRIASPNTLDALVRLAEHSLLDVTTYRQLREGYIFLRTIEHALQLLHNQQTHELPVDAEKRDWLARRMDYPGEAELLARFNEHRVAVRRIFDQQFEQTPPAADENRQRKASDVSPTGDVNSQDATTDPFGSTLGRFLQQHGQANADLRQLALEDLQRDGVCRVHSSVAAGDAAQRLITIIAHEVSGLTSMLCGLFFACGLDIREGETINGGGRSRFGYEVPRGRFVGVFLCDEAASTIANGVTATDAYIQSELERLLRLQLVESESVVRETIVDMFCQRVAQLSHDAPPLAELQLELAETAAADMTVLRIEADDSYGFFFELSNALTICGFRILRAELGSANGRVRDVIHVAEASGGAITTGNRIEELRTAVTLIKQFTSWLPSNNDPHKALIRFRDLLQRLLRSAAGEARVADLRQPDVLRAVGQVLGMSRYLWEDFLQVRTETLLPLLTDPLLLQQRIAIATLRSEVRDALAAASSSEAKTVALNAFKDHHLFRIDLRHLLGHSRPFGSFSEEITELAEVVVEAALNLIRVQLVEKYGEPRRRDGTNCAFTIAALGKFGGVEMGFASDIELFGIFQEDCRTDGKSSISASSFFERLVTQASALIQSRQRGIFEIDLRMRPYGNAGPPAVSLETFRSYFSAEGDAWPYERQSLVRLRCVCGDVDFGDHVVATCHELIYVNAQFDFNAMRGMREKQRQQLVRGGTVNAKLSDGGLVDCEYAVQALQLTFGDHLPKLRTPSTLQTLRAAMDADLLTRAEYQQARTAYAFLRELIDCLRMTRGNAQDLTVPATNSPEYQQLARRMDAVHDSALPLSQLETQMANVQAFADRVEEICGVRRRSD